MVQVSAIYGKAANEHETAPRVNALRARDGPLTRPLDSNASTVYELALESFQKVATVEVWAGERSLRYMKK